ncbi:hypothetical protein [Micromonospora sp. NBC_00617]|uniref:hypothetical protein n=1 Tax=Micromonospora sp. NBC_00617 TaxID=2903587 RepID=UPI0030E25920
MARTRKRKIRVDDVDYRWTVSRADPGHVVVRVWGINGGQNVRLEERVTFDDPWLNYGPIITTDPERVAEVFALDPVTPRLVERMIRSALADPVSGAWRT